MKVVTLNIGRDDYMETKALFIIGDINNFNELEFLKRVKKEIRPHIGDCFSLSTTDEKIELQVKEFLNIVKQGGETLWLSGYDYLELEEMEVL